MPKAKTSTRASASQKSQDLLILTDGKKHILIPRPKTYNAALDAVRRHFPKINQDRVKLQSVQTDQVEICDGELTEIAAESWETVVELVSSVFVAETPQCLGAIKPVNLWRPNRRSW
ncbi:hypothetical protein C8R44DRAFT_812147 [Mycena epipterygia]|nr:hypothetical protein C8R44DRAFT_812147 [Mycena epipterygia]